MAENYAESFVNCNITSSASEFSCDRRFSRHESIASLKGKLELLTGANPSTMQLQLYSKDGQLVCKLDDDLASLGSYPAEDGMRIHVIDKSGQAADLGDLSKVEKFEISEEAYSKRTDSVRAFKQRMKVGQFKELTPEENEQKEKEEKQKKEEEQRLLESMHAGDRCEVQLQGQPPKRGQVKFLGELHCKPPGHLYVGVQCDEPLGKNDGSVEGKRYFECPPKYGIFVPIKCVKVGDYPELDFEHELDEM